jgi:hypothetical protein
MIQILSRISQISISLSSRKFRTKQTEQDEKLRCRFEGSLLSLLRHLSAKKILYSNPPEYFRLVSIVHKRILQPILPSRFRSSEHEESSTEKK